MKKFLLLPVLILSALFSAGQNIGIGTTTPHSSAQLDVASTTKGFLPPRMTSLQRTGISTPQKGLMVFDTNTASYWCFNDAGWKEITFGGSSSDSTFLVGDPNPGPVSQYLVSASSVFDTSGIVFDTGGEFGNYGNNEDFELNIYPSLLFNALGVKVTIMQMVLQNINDSVIITASSGQKRYYTGTVGAQQFILNGSSLRIESTSNSSVTAAGFKIRFDFIFPPAQQTGNTQISGWTYIPSKLAVRGGFDAEFAAQPDSIGILSFGYGGSVLAKGNYSVGLGNFVFATGASSVAIGTDAHATNSGSVAIGERVTATGSNAFALGNLTEATGNFSTASGYSTNASGSSSFAANAFTEATGSSSASFGRNTSAQGNYSMAIGEFTDAIGQRSLATGYFSKARGINSLASGEQSEAFGENSIAFGYFSKSVGELSVAIGDNTRATGTIATAIGLSTQARAYASLVIGRFNDSISSSSPTTWVATDPVFIIGNGTSGGVRSNAMTILKNAKTGINTATPLSGLHIKAVDGSFDQHIRLESTVGPSSYANILYDGALKCRVFDASGNFQWRDAGNNTRMRLLSDGNLEIDGTLSQGSDARLKKNIVPVQQSLQKILALNGYQYYWIDSTRDKNIQSGVLAQEVEKQMPELVTTDNDGMKAVNYSGMIPYLIESIKELKKENDEMKKEILLLKKKQN